MPASIREVLTRPDKKSIASPWVQTVITERRQSQDLSFTDIDPAVQASEDWIATN